MSKGIRRIALAACCVALAAGLAQQAGAFFPKGGFDAFGQLRYAVWPLKDFDTNNNGTIERNEGLEFRIEGGVSGFTVDEIERVKAGFQVWADVPTSYVRFRFAGVVEDPILPGTTTPDYLPTVFMQVTEAAPGDTNVTPDAAEFLVPEVTGNITLVTLTLYAITDVPVTAGGDIVTVPAGNILDSDIIVNASLHRAGLFNTTFGPLDLKATIVQSAGSLLGLGFTPLNNLEEFNLASLTSLPIETTALQMTGADGIPRMIGATPTMFPAYFLTENAEGQTVGGWGDLAPDDISGISWLYPRQDGQERFFSISQEARTHTRRGTGIPSSPISGGHIVAWANVSNNEGDRRVPLFSTMSGLYEPFINKNLVGGFDLLGLWKQIEVPGTPGDLFNTSYVLSLNPLNGGGVSKQAPPGVTPSLVDSLQGALPVSYSVNTRPSSDFATNYPSEVYNEFGNIYGIENNPAGTALVWDFTKNTIVSKASEKTIPTMLPLNRPMFGDPNDVCPLNVITGSSGTGTTAVNTGTGTTTAGIKALREFRDDVLLRSAPGAALVDAYYQISPVVARFLLRHALALKAGRTLLAAMEWVMVNWAVCLAALSALGVVFWASRRRRARAAAAAAMVAVLALAGTVAHAGEIYMPTASIVGNATEIVTGKVTSAQGRWGQAGRIYTDVVIEVAGTAKGTANKASNISFSVIGGAVGGFAMSASDIPSFAVDEEVVLYLYSVPGRGLCLYGGERGKQLVITDTPTGKKYVTGSGAFAEATMAADKKAIAEKAAAKQDKDESAAKAAAAQDQANKIPLDDYMQYLRDIAAQEARAAVK